MIVASKCHDAIIFQVDIKLKSVKLSDEIGAFFSHLLFSVFLYND